MMRDFNNYSARNLTDKERIELYSMPVVWSGCWIWLSTLQNTGYHYGRFFDRNTNRSLLAHRCAWQAYFGEIPRGMDVLHSCDEPMCVNPSHLFLGNHRDNMLDAMRKGRNVKGGRVNTCKLTQANVLFIRASHESNEALALMLGVTESTVRFARTKRTWKWL